VAFVEALRLELAAVLVATDQLADRLAGQILTEKGQLRAPARTRQRLLERATALVNLLGYAKADAPNGKRPWSKLTRQEQELEAQRAIEQVEKNLRGGVRAEDDDARD
jgi:hypothetical protein